MEIVKMINSHFLPLLVLACCILPIHNELIASECRKGDDCSRDGVGMVCMFMYEPCDVGMCRCPDGMINDNGQCLNDAKLDEECQTDAQCTSIGNALCKDSFCQCRDSHKAYSGKCMAMHEVKIGDDCTPSDICKYYNEHSHSLLNTPCTDGICTCPDHTLEMTDDAPRCNNRLLGDGCRAEKQCSNVVGGICTDGVCTCQAGYEEVNARTCTPVSDIGDVAAGEYCSLDRKCKEDLVCKKCYTRAKNKTCVYTKSDSTAIMTSSYTHTFIVYFVAMVIISTKFC